ncbi:MAG: hypothetical protein ACJAX3_001194 [Patiriisocius sp.]|jgi:hypothetical protein
MKEYKMLQSMFNWMQNIQNLEYLHNSYARQGWITKDGKLIGCTDTNSIAILEKSKG